MAPAQGLSATRCSPRRPVRPGGTESGSEGASTAAARSRDGDGGGDIHERSVARMRPRSRGDDAHRHDLVREAAVDHHVRSARHLAFGDRRRAIGQRAGGPGRLLRRRGARVFRSGGDGWTGDDNAGDALRRRGPALLRDSDVRGAFDVRRDVNGPRRQRLGLAPPWSFEPRRHLPPTRTIQRMLAQAIAWQRGGRTRLGLAKSAVCDQSSRDASIPGPSAGSAGETMSAGETRAAPLTARSALSATLSRGRERTGQH